MRYRTRLYIDLHLLYENVEKIRRLCPHNQILFMVKGDAYGHGMTQMVRFAVTELDIKEFGCATLGEARRLRDELPDLQFEVYVFSDTNLEFQSCADYYLHRRIIPVLSNLADLEYVLSDRDFLYFPLCLKFNTGMNRLGIMPAEVDQVISLFKKYQRKNIFHLITHFGTSSDLITSGSITERQYECFKAIKKQLLSAGIEIERSSAANSGAIEQGYALEETHIRPGLMLYGPSSLNASIRHQSLWTGRCISRLETYIISAFNVKKGDGVGYGNRTIPEEGAIGLIAIGYGDGFNGRMQAPEIYYAGHRGYIFGRVNMDMTQVFFPGIDQSQLKLTDKIFIWGHAPSEVLRFADQTGAIPYELFCGLTSRVPRLYGLDDLYGK